MLMPREECSCQVDEFNAVIVRRKLLRQCYRQRTHDFLRKPTKVLEVRFALLGPDRAQVRDLFEKRWIFRVRRSAGHRTSVTYPAGLC